MNKFLKMRMCARLVSLAITVSILTVACKHEGKDGPTQAPSSQKASMYDFNLSRANIDAYMEYKQIPAEEKRKRDRAIRSLIVRNALAEVIVQQEWPTQSDAQIHIKDRRNQILINSYFDDYVERHVNEQAVQAFFENNRALFADKKIKLAQIIKPVPANAKERKQTVEQMRQLVKKLKEGGDFTTAARKHSQSKDKQQGDKLAWLTESDIDRVLFNTALKMKKGDVYGPIDTSKHLVIIKLVDGPVLEERALEDIKDQVLHQFKYKLKLDETARLNKLAASRIEQEQKTFATMR